MVDLLEDSIGPSREGGEAALHQRAVGRKGVEAEGERWGLQLLIGGGGGG